MASWTTHMRLSLFACVTLVACASASAETPNPERNAYFGEQHIHTSWSVDAWLFGNYLTGPKEAYEYAKGGTIKHPQGYDIRIEQLLDWMGVTDHSEYVGITKMANTPGSPVSKLPEAQPLILKNPDDPADVQKVFLYLVGLVSKPPVKSFMTPEVAGSIWKENTEIANKANEPGKFTAFCSYEFTSQYTRCAMPGSPNKRKPPTAKPMRKCGPSTPCCCRQRQTPKMKAKRNQRRDAA